MATDPNVTDLRNRDRAVLCIHAPDDDLDTFPYYRLLALGRSSCPMVS